MSTGRRHLVVAMLAGALGATALHGQGPALTLEWITSAAPQHLASLARFAWRRDGRALLFDVRQPADSRAFEILDPRTKARTRLVSAAEALTRLNRLVDPNDKVDAMRWPDSVDDNGDRGLYTIGGDLFVLEFASGAWTRLTRTPEAEVAAVFSPDGTRVAFVRGHDLYSIDIATAREARLTRDGTDTRLNGTLSWLYWEEIFGRRDMAFWWSDDSQAVAFLQTDESPVALSHFVGVAPVPPAVLTQRYPFAGGANPKVRVGIVEVTHPGAVHWIVLPDPAPEYVTRVQWLPGSRRIAVEGQTRDQKHIAISLADRSGGAAKAFLTDSDPGWVNITDDLYFESDGHIIWASERDGYEHLYRYSAAGTLENQITRGPWAIASNAGGVPWLRQAVAGIDEPGDWIYYTSLEASSVERQLYRIHSDGSGESRISSERGTHAVRFSPDARYYFDRFADSHTLWSLSLHSADGALVETISAARTEAIAALGLQYPELLTIPAADGFPMPAKLWKPAGFDPSHRYPLIMYVYGGASSPVVADLLGGYDFYNQLLLREGYLVAYVDNRTATGISKTLENQTVGVVGEPETRDLVDAVRWLKGQPWVDGSRVGVWGWSGGGTMTLNLMTRSTEFQAGISVAPVTDWRYYDTRIAEMFLGRPQDHPQAYDATSLIPHAGDLHGRLLLVHGSYDDNVHPQNEQAFINALVEKGIIFDLMVYPMRQHGIDDPAAEYHLFKTMLDFWKRSL